MAKRRIPNSSISDMLTGKSGIDILKDLSDNRNIGKIDYVAMQLNQPSLVFKELITDDEKMVIYDRHEDYDAALWNGLNVKLTSIFTSSLQSPETKIYYRNVYDSMDTSIDPEFTISYGDYYGYGSSTGSFGRILSSVTESKAIYSKYQNLLLGTDENLFKFKRPSWHTESEIYSRVYLTGIRDGSIITQGGTRVTSSGLPTTQFVLNEVDEIFTDPGKTSQVFTTKLPVDNWKQVELVNAGMLLLKEEGTIWGLGFNSQNYSIGYHSPETIYNYPVLAQTGSDWDYISSGINHTLAIKKDGSLWGWGRNISGELGTSTIGIWNDPERIGGNSSTWKYVAAGNECSIGIQTDGTLWVWGSNNAGQFGLGNYTTYYSPFKVGSDTNWKSVSIGKSTHVNAIACLFLKETGQLYGAGKNDLYQLGLGNTSLTSNLTLITTGVSKMAMGTFSAVAIKTDGTLWRWGDPPWDIARTSPQQITSAGSNWSDVYASDLHFIGTKNTGLVYTWGIYGALGDQDSAVYTEPIIPKILPILQEQSISPLNAISISAFGQYDFPNVPGNSEENRTSAFIYKYDNLDISYYEESDYIYAININQNRFKDSVKPGSWQLSLTSVDLDGVILSGSRSDSNKITTLIDDSSLYNTDIDENDVYNVYSGSVSDGFYTGSFAVPYGLFYPKRGIILLNGRALNSFCSIFTNRTPVTSSGAVPFSSNADKIYASLSGSMNINSSSYYFQGTSSERIESMYSFIRIKSEEFNFSNNSSYVTGSSGFIKPRMINNELGITYITTIGLYDDEKNLVAVAKLSKPIKKTIEKEMVIKIRIRY